MAIAAALSVVALVSVGAWQIWGRVHESGAVRAENQTLTPPSEQAETPFSRIDWQSALATGDGAVPASLDSGTVGDADGLSNISTNVLGTLVDSYASLQQAGTYTPDEGERIATDIAASLSAHVSYTKYAADDITTASDTSYDRMLAYRGDMQIALGPLLKNTEYELSIFARYIETGNMKDLTRLKNAAQNYRDAIANAAKVPVPTDAVSYHVGILNALSEFAATLEGLARSADDPFAGAALLRSYNTAEQNVLVSFNALAQYSKNKSS